MNPSTVVKIKLFLPLAIAVPLFIFSSYFQYISVHKLPIFNLYQVLHIAACCLTVYGLVNVIIQLNLKELDLYMSTFVWTFLLSLFSLVTIVELSKIRTEKLMSGDTIESVAVVQQITEHYGRWGNSELYHYSYSIQDETFWGYGNIENNPVQVGDSIEVLVSANEHSVHRLKI